MCYRGLKVEKAFNAILTAKASDKDLFKLHYDNLVTEKNTLMAERRERQLAGEQLPYLALTHSPLCCWLISEAHHLA